MNNIFNNSLISLVGVSAILSGATMANAIELASNQTEKNSNAVELLTKDGKKKPKDNTNKDKKIRIRKTSLKSIPLQLKIQKQTLKMIYCSP